MACNVKVVAAFGRSTGGVIYEIYVEGTSSNCSKVRITLTCESSGASTILQTVEVATVPQVSPNPDKWFNTFKNLPNQCVCGGSIKVKAEGIDEGGVICGVNDDSEDFVDLSCIDQPVIPVCPAINFSKTIGDCKADGTREISITATLTGQNCTAELRDSGNTLLAGPKTGMPVTLNHTGNYPVGNPVKFNVVVTQPAGCSGASDTFNVPTCEPPAPTGGGVTVGIAKEPAPGDLIPSEPEIVDVTRVKQIPPKKDESGNGGGGSSNKCGGMLWAVAVLLSLGAALTAVSIAWYPCVIASVPPTWLWVSAAACDILGGVLIGVWYWLCSVWPECECPTKCDWLQISLMVALAGATILGWLSTCCPIWYIAVAFAAVYAGAEAAWFAACKPSKCQILMANLTAFASGAAPAIAYLAWHPALAACASTLVTTAEATITAVLAALAAASCNNE